MFSGTNKKGVLNQLLLEFLSEVHIELLFYVCHTLSRIVLLLPLLSKGRTTPLCSFPTLSLGFSGFALFLKRVPGKETKLGDDKSGG